MTHSQTDTIIKTIQSWLDWQQHDRDAEGLPTGDDTAVMSVPVWPSRGQLKNWIAHLSALDAQHLERTHAEVEKMMEAAANTIATMAFLDRHEAVRLIRNLPIESPSR